VSKPISVWPQESLERDKSVPEEGGASAYIQWKGTSVCMDVHCVCGAHGHIDDEFAYYYECSKCGRVFSVGSTVRLYELDPDLKAKTLRDSSCIKKDPTAGHYPDCALHYSGDACDMECMSPQEPS